MSLKVCKVCGNSANWPGIGSVAVIHVSESEHMFVREAEAIVDVAGAPAKDVVGGPPLEVLANGVDLLHRIASLRQACEWAIQDALVAFDVGLNAVLEEARKRNSKVWLRGEAVDVG